METKDQNNLNELNEILFKTLRGVEEGKVDRKHAQTVANLGNTIINNAKTQLQAYKLTGGKTGIPALPVAEIVAGNGIKVPKDTYDQQRFYARSKGYDSVAEAISELGKDEFLRQVKKWVDSNS